MDLNNLLELEQIDKNIFKGQNIDLFVTKNVYGGQVIAQALSAAYKTITDKKILHSCHAYFLLRGDLNLPIIYEVDLSRDGKSFSTRRVVAIQNGKQIFNGIYSFQIEENSTFDTRDVMPHVLQPEELLSHREILKKYKDQLPPNIKEILEIGLPFEVKNVYQPDALNKVNTLHYWIKSNSRIYPNNDINSHITFAYLSDYNLLLSVMFRFEHFLNFNKYFVASLDHAFWLHRPIDMNDWLLIAVENPNNYNNRSLVKAKVFNKSGILVASLSQEGIIRKISD